MTRPEWSALVMLAAAALAAVALRLLVGGGGLALPESDAVWELRGVRAAAGVVVGASLGLGGLLLQALLRNPLASPDLMGLSSGAGLAVVLAAVVRWRLTGELGVGPEAGLVAALGACGALGLVWTLARRRGIIDPPTMVLVGVIVGVGCAAATVAAQQFLPDRGLSTARWFLGRLDDDTNHRAIALAGVLALAALAWSAWRGPRLDAAMLGEDEARSVGLDLKRLRAVEFVLAGVLTAAAVTLAGPIGFVGLVCPHLVRMLAGPGHRAGAIGSAIAGAGLLVAADAGIKAFSIAGGRLPVGVATSVLGAPLFLWLLLRDRR